MKGDANRSNVFSAFFTPGSSAYVGDLAHVKNLICGHSYWTDGTWDGMRNVRKQVAQAAGQYNLDVWQSEWSMLGDNYSSSEFVGYEQASEMDIAFYMSKVIHNDLTVAGVSSWSYWTSMDVSRWGHKNRFLLISLVPAGGEYGDMRARREAIRLLPLFGYWAITAALSVRVPPYCPRLERIAYFFRFRLAFSRGG